MIRKKAADYRFTYTLISANGVKCKMHSDVVRNVGDEIYLNGIQHTVAMVESKQNK